MSHKHTTVQLHHQKMVEKKLAEAQLQEQVMQARAASLSRIASAQLAQLDCLCANDKDRLDVLSSLVCFLAVRAKGTRDELVKVIDEQWPRQVQNCEQLKASLPQPPAPSVSESPPAASPNQASP